MSAPRPRALAPAILASLAVGAVATPPADAAFGPKQKKCAKLKGSAKKRCQKQNKTVKTAFNAVKNGRYVGRTSQGVGLDITLCASGRWAIAVASGGETSTFTGSRWALQTAGSAQGRLYAGIDAPSRNIYTDEFFLVRRGTAWGWTRGNPTFDDLSKFTRTDAAAACAALD